jgi:hypothetical protein
MDNVSSHGRWRRRAILARGANVFYLPPYSPDFKCGFDIYVALGTASHINRRLLAPKRHITGQWIGSDSLLNFEGSSSRVRRFVQLSQPHIASPRGPMCEGQGAIPRPLRRLRGSSSDIEAACRATAENQSVRRCNIRQKVQAPGSRSSDASLSVLPSGTPTPKLQKAC